MTADPRCDACGQPIPLDEEGRISGLCQVCLNGPLSGRVSSPEPCPFCGQTIDRHSTLDMSCPPGRVPTTPEQEQVARAIDVMTADPRCDGCGRRGVALYGLDLLDGGTTFAVCEHCLVDARKVCGRVETFELVER